MDYYSIAAQDTLFHMAFEGFFGCLKSELEYAKISGNTDKRIKTRKADIVALENNISKVLLKKKEMLERIVNGKREFNHEKHPKN